MNRRNTAKQTLLIATLMAGAGNMALAQTCTYELTMARSPEALNAAELRQQLDRLGVKYTQSQFNDVVSKRTSGYTAKNIVQYKREGQRLEGPLLSVNGMTLELEPDRFMVDSTAFASYHGSKNAIGMLIVRKPEHYRSVCTAYEERLLLGEGTLADRVKAIQSEIGLVGQPNPNNENAKATDNGFDVYFGKNLIYKVVLKQADTVSIVKMVPANFETLTYRQIPNQKFEAFENFVPTGSTVSDYRLSDLFPAQYKWASALPTLEAIANKGIDRGDRSPIPIGVVMGLSAIACGAFVGLSFFAKTEKRKEPRD